MEEPKPRKRTQACIHCRSRKLKCQFTIESKNCDRCHNLGIECKVQNKNEERYTFEVVTQRLDRLETVMTGLVQFLHSKYGHDLGIDLDDMEHNPRKRSRGDDDDESLDLTPPGHSANGDSRPITLLSASQTKECIDYFVSNVSKYLPVLIFDYMPEFKTIESNLLVTAIVAVATLYHPKFREYHTAYVSEFTTVLENLCTSSGLATPSASHDAIDGLLNDVLGLSVAGAWLGTELGFRAILVASRMISRIMPLFVGTFSTVMNVTVRTALEPKVCAIGLVTYIIEQRLRIMHGRPVKQPAPVGSDFYVNYLFSTMTRYSSSQAGRVKAMANVDLCAVITNFQRELAPAASAKIVTGLSFFNEQLERWLAEWFGKMTVHLRPSSWKPLFLTLLYAKLLLNLHAVDNLDKLSGDSHPSDPSIDTFTTYASKSAIDALDMIVYDDDMPRLISYGPVFYPTIFVTAGASILKLVWLKSEGKPIVLNHSRESLVNLVKLAHSRLSASIYLPTMPCYDTIRNLGLSLQRVSDALHLDSTEQALSLSNRDSWDSNRFRLWEPRQEALPEAPTSRGDLIPQTDNAIGSAGVLDTEAHPTSGTATTDLLDGSLWPFDLADSGDSNFLFDIHSTSLLESLGDIGSFEGDV